MYKHILLLLLFVIQSCSNPNKSNKSDSDFLAYYNTFYMAEKYYEEALEIIKVNQNEILPKEAEDLLNKAIENSLVIEKKFYNSQYLDDSFFILGMASFYKGNITSSEYYFNRILLEHDLSQFYNVTLIMYGNLYLKMNRIIELEKLINKINEIDLSINEKYEFNLLLANYYEYIDDFENVEESYNSALINSSNKNDQLSIYYRLLSLSELTNNFINAVKYIDEIQNILDQERINNELFQKWIDYNIKIEEYDRVSRKLKTYISNENILKTKMYYEVELANVYMYQRNYIESKDLLLTLIDEYIDNSLLKKELGKAYFLLGNIFLEYDWDFDKSKEAYQNCMNISKSSYYGKESQNRLNSIISYLNYKEEIFYNETIEFEEKSYDDGLLIPEIKEYNGLDSLIFHSGQILFFDLGIRDSAISEFKTIVYKFPNSKYHFKSLLILDLEQPNSIWKNMLNNNQDLEQNNPANISIDLLIDSSWDLLSISSDDAIASLFDIHEKYDASKPLYIIGFIYDDYLKDIDNAILYYKMYLDKYKDGEYFVKTTDRILELESMIDTKIKYFEQKLNLRKGKNWFIDKANIDSSLYYLNLASNGIDRGIKVYCNNISESIKLYEENKTLLKNNYSNIDSAKLNLAHILYKDLSFDDIAINYYKEIIYNDNIKNYVNESYACLSLIENNANWDSLLYANLNDSNLYNILKNNARRKFYYNVKGTMDSDNMDLLWLNEIQNKHFYKIEENNLEIE